MKQFIVDIDFTCSRRQLVEAESEEQAIEITNRLISKHPHEYLGVNLAYIKHEIIDVYEED